MDENRRKVMSLMKGKCWLLYLLSVVLLICRMMYSGPLVVSNFVFYPNKNDQRQMFIFIFSPIFTHG